MISAFAIFEIFETYPKAQQKHINHIKDVTFYTFIAWRLYIFICIRLADHAALSLLLLCVWSAPITELMPTRWFYDRGGQRQMLNILSAAQSDKIPPNLPFPPPSIGILHHKNQSTKYHSISFNWPTRDFLKTTISCILVSARSQIHHPENTFSLWTSLLWLICFPLNDSGQIVHNRCKVFTKT